ncbi:MAG: hypothetical protein L3J09_06440 [Flavobacteriaceae bacterium]|nr:hypothetical protein [Flavobacteriaceae bacterium]
MLIDHYDYFLTSNKSPYFIDYQADLAANGLSNSNGYPLLSRNISIINGSLTGVKNAQPSQRFLDMRGYIDLSWWPFNWRINVLTIKNNYQQEINQTGMVLDIRAYRADWNFYNSLIAHRTNTNWQGSRCGSWWLL